MRAPFLVLTRRWLHRKLVSKQALSLERCWGPLGSRRLVFAPGSVSVLGSFVSFVSDLLVLGTLSSPGLDAPNAAGG